MNTKQFEDIINRQIGLSKEVLIEKAKEYATEDRLHNFRVAAQLQNCTMEQALGGFLCKHTVSIYDMINSGSTYPNDKWDEKITDHINYLLILRAIVEETNSEKIFDLSEDDCVDITYGNGDRVTLYKQFKAEVVETERQSIERQLKQEPVFQGMEYWRNPDTPPEFLEKKMHVREKRPDIPSFSPLETSALIMREEKGVNRDDR